MNIISGETYHIYNQGNNKELIFSCHEDYSHFISLVRKFVLPCSKILAYCLMPNHFHFLVHATEKSDKKITIGNIELSGLSNGFRLLQSNYASYFNKKNDRSGSLFRQKTKAKAITDAISQYAFIVFQYIHQNPLRAGLVPRLEDWAYSSFQDYLLEREDSICDRELCMEIIGYNRKAFLEESYKMIDEVLIRRIF